MAFHVKHEFDLYIMTKVLLNAASNGGWPGYIPVPNCQPMATRGFSTKVHDKMYFLSANESFL